MKLNASKTVTIMVSMSRPIHPQSIPLTLDGSVQKKAAVLVILCVTLDTKINFEKRRCSVSSAAPEA